MSTPPPPQDLMTLLLAGLESMEYVGVTNPWLRKAFTAFVTPAMINPTNTTNSIGLFITECLKFEEKFKNLIFKRDRKWKLRLGPFWRGRSIIQTYSSMNTVKDPRIVFGDDGQMLWKWFCTHMQEGLLRLVKYHKNEIRLLWICEFHILFPMFGKWKHLLLNKRQMRLEQLRLCHRLPRTKIGWRMSGPIGRVFPTKFPQKADKRGETANQGDPVV